MPQRSPMVSVAAVVALASTGCPYVPEGEIRVVAGSEVIAPARS